MGSTLNRWIGRFSVSVALSSAVAAVSWSAGAAPGALLYSENFDGIANGALPPGWNSVVGSWAVEGGRLVGQAGTITRITFGPHAENYRFEATVRFEMVTNSTRWLAPVLDIAPSGATPWWQAAMRTTTTASNGLEFAWRTTGNAWNVPFTAAAPSSAGTDRDVRVAIEVQGSRASWIFDGQRRLEGLIQRSENGVLGFTADGARVSIDDVIVTELGPWSPVARNGELPVTVAHRGYSSVNPENTLAAYAAAMKAGAEYVEIDVHTTEDGVPVVMHDQSVDRTTDGTGNVARLPSAYLAGLEAGSWFSPAFADQPSATFAQMLELMSTGSSSMLLEIKGPETQTEVYRIVDMVTARGLSSRVLIQSFDEGVLRNVKARAPQIATGLLRSSLDADPVTVSRGLGVAMYNPNAGALSTRSSVIQELNDAGIAVFAWTVDAPADWKLLTDAGVDGIITNRAGAFIGWKEAWEQAAAPTASVSSPAALGQIERGGDVVAARRSPRKRPEVR